MLAARFIHNLAFAAVFVVFSFSAQAAANRTFVSTGGSDSNTSLNCGGTTPCRTFGAALSVTNSGGEIVVLTSGGYGPATITEAVTITAVGVTASITATGGADGLDINTSGNVTIRGLGFHGQGTGENGILVSNVGALRLYNVIVENFSFVGIWFKASSGSLAIYDSHVSGNGNAGLGLSTGSVYVKNTIFDYNEYGFAQVGGNVVVEDSAAVGNSVAGFDNGGGSLSLVRDEAVWNGVGIVNRVGGSTQFAYSNISQNTNYAINVMGGTISGSNLGTSVVSGTVSGSLSTAVNLR